MASDTNPNPLLVIDRPTHAGGVVLRGRGASLRVLLVTAKRQPNQWVFPKGHIEPGETVEQTAIREVEEEAGVVATVGEPIGTLEFRNARGVVRAQFFVMAFVSEDTPREGRRRGWFTVEEARQALGYEDSRMLVVRARQAWPSMALGTGSE
jgi:8-oxo-dGTP pyrophosphatase MutT (NUDIX family)